MELRPASFAEFNGQPKALEKLRIIVGAAKSRGDTLKHVLLSGPPGLGKTTLAQLLANEMEAECQYICGAIIEKSTDLLTTLMRLKEGDFLFIDEIHRLPIIVEEFLYSAMEDTCIDILIDDEEGAQKNVRVPLEPFTLVGATTRQGMLSAPLLSRFTLKLRLEPYTDDALQHIATRSAEVMGLTLDKEAGLIHAQSCRGTPRILNNQLKFTRDVACLAKTDRVTGGIARESMRLLGISPTGLDEVDQAYLALLARNTPQPIGIESVAVALGEVTETLLEVHEPYLIQRGWINRSPRGRLLTDAGQKLIDNNFKMGQQQKL
jgi:Holliday junction DNA helicase RuvB